jgi:hypothetical protein
MAGPIRREHRWFYPIDWPKLSAVIRFRRAQGRREQRGRPHSFGCIWPWLTRRRVTMASSAITRPYRSAAGSSWDSSAMDFTIGP